MTSLSRRDFVAATTLGAVGLLRGTAALAQPARPRAADALLYVGTYTEAGRTDGLYLLRMDTLSGALRQVEALDVGANPSFLTIHPNGRTLYSVNEVTETEGRPTGAVRAFAIDAESGALTWLDEQPSEGAAPCYVSTDRKGRFVLVANYVSGTVATLPIDETGALDHASHVVQHVGKGPVTARQEHAHAHCVVPHPSNRFVLAADLGVDRVLVYRFDEGTGALQHLEERDAVLPPGTGPRHLAFHPTLPLVFVSGELNSTVTALHCDPQTGALRVVQTLSTLPASFKGENYPADIHVARSGRTLYVSNRGHNSVAVFSIAAKGTLTLQQVMSTGGNWPRNFTIDPSGRWLLVANQKSGSVEVFARDAESGRLTATSQRIELPSPVCIRFQAHAGV
ncbi:MAG: lactonase family protein [Polaromonas sp.]|nr:lactonase family protein [Gemmatimonadaceae bacterium]